MLAKYSEVEYMVRIACLHETCDFCLRKYTLADGSAVTMLQDMDGARLQLATDKVLILLGLTDPLVRIELLKARDALAKQHATFAIMIASEKARADAAAAAESLTLVGLTSPPKRIIYDAQLVTALSDGTIILVHSPPSYLHSPMPSQTC